MFFLFSKYRMTIVITLSLILSLIIPKAVAQNGDYNLTWFKVSSGGGKSEGGGYTLAGTIGQPEAGLILKGGSYTLVGGFWPSPSRDNIYYLPIIFKNFALAPDLIVESITATHDMITVVIKNIGSAPASDAFWVDVYIAPDNPPRNVNQRWDMLGSQGLAWGVTESIPVGGTLVLAINDDYYQENLSNFSPLEVGTPVYAQVDSVNFDTLYGGVLENHEISGEGYNNIIGPAFSTFETTNREMFLTENVQRSTNSKLPPR